MTAIRSMHDLRGRATGMDVDGTSSRALGCSAAVSLDAARPMGDAVRSRYDERNMQEQQLCRMPRLKPSLRAEHGPPSSIRTYGVPRKRTELVAYMFTMALERMVQDRVAICLDCDNAYFVFNRSSRGR